jgi:prevent-host-death family protein
VTTIGSFEARTHFSDLLRRVESGGEHFVLTVRGKPVAVLGPVDTEAGGAQPGLAETLENLRQLRARVAARDGPVLPPGESWQSFAREGLEGEEEL